MDNSNLDTEQIKHPDEARIFNFVKDFLDDSSVSDGVSERMKTLEDQEVIINRPTKYGSSFFLSKSLQETTDDNSNTINTTPTVSLASNICVQTTILCLVKESIS